MHHVRLGPVLIPAPAPDRAAGDHEDEKNNDWRQDRMAAPEQNETGEQALQPVGRLPRKLAESRTKNLPDPSRQPREGSN